MQGKPHSHGIILALLMALPMIYGLSANGQPVDEPTPFPPLNQWRSAVLAGNAAELKAVYSSGPAAHVMANGVVIDADGDANFWLGLKARSIKLEIVHLVQRHGGISIVFKAEVTLPDGRTMRITDGQGWREQNGQWQLASVERADEPHLAQPSDMNKNIYPADADAHAEIKAAEEKAEAEHKRVILIFGANWCFDCHVLDLAFHRPDFASAMAGFEVVHVDIGPDGQKNGDVANQLDVPLNKGIPALAIVASDGKLVVSQKNGEFEDARSMTPEALLEFLNKWKPESR